MDAQTEQQLPWHDPAWRAEAEAWIERQVGDIGARLAGEITQPHAFWWSSVLRAPTTTGVLWFKATQPEGAFEARLTPLLAAGWPDAIVELVATDAERGWTLARDAGAKLRALNDGSDPVGHWAQLLPRYGEIQVALAVRVDELLALGVPDLRLPVVAEELGQALDEPETLMMGTDAGLAAADRDRLVAGANDFADLCRRLAEAGIPDSIQHDDLNDGNAFLRGGDHVVFDWGDACISHPFHSLVVALRSLAYRHRWSPGGPEITRLRDAYLEPWDGFAPHDELTAIAEMARRTGTVQRSMAWRRSAWPMPTSIRDEYLESVAYGLRLYLLDGPWGTWDDGSF